MLAFDAMDEFMKHILDAVQKDGGIAIRVFPAESQVLLAFSERLAVEVVSPAFPPSFLLIHLHSWPSLQVGEYIVPLLTKAREVSNEVFLKAAAASFREAWRMVDVLMQISGEIAKDRSPTIITRVQAEDVM